MGAIDGVGSAAALDATEAGVAEVQRLVAAGQLRIQQLVAADLHEGLEVAAEDVLDLGQRLGVGGLGDQREHAVTHDDLSLP